MSDYHLVIMITRFVYEYFNNKEALLKELTRIGYIKLANEIEEARDKFTDAAKQLEAMWMAYWQFAFKKKELYQLMFGVSMNCCSMQKDKEAEAPALLITTAIRHLMKGKTLTEEEVSRRYYTFWSVVHGLVSINLVNRGASDEINKLVLKDAISGIIAAMKQR